MFFEVVGVGSKRAGYFDVGAFEQPRQYVTFLYQVRKRKGNLQQLLRQLV